jgi:hypothetical protein
MLHLLSWALTGMTLTGLCVECLCLASLISSANFQLNLSTLKNIETDSYLHFHL